MPVVVMKFGGTSVGSVERIQAVADRVVRTREAGSDVVVVVSAMGDTTDELSAMALRIAEVPDPRELDMLLTAGERIAMSLLGIALIARGCRAASYTGSQAGIITDTQHGPHAAHPTPEPHDRGTHAEAAVVPELDRCAGTEDPPARLGGSEHPGAAEPCPSS